MDYELSEHAKLVIEERNISKIHLERTLQNPDLVYIDEMSLDLEHRFKVIQENENRVLHVIVNILSIPIRVVTVFFDRRMKNKL
ncbi:MAG: DUF4258 domain-containing protein [Leptospiraceae bacterium]|nr:DUF4258 domain-containing protein [Leptospiraceae bacterium]